MINIERDSHGRVYQIWKQDQMNSCGVASTWMARGIAKRMSFAEEEWDLAQRMYRTAVANALGTLGAPSVSSSSSGPMTLNPSAFGNNQGSFGATFANFGLYAGQVAAALRSEGLRVQHVPLNGRARTILPDKIAIDRPAIALVYWNGGGGHFIVAGRCTHRSVSWLDPWDGHVNEQPNNGAYNAAYGSAGLVGEVIYLSA